MKINQKDLTEIHNYACDKMIALSTRSLYQLDNKIAQTYAFTCAVVMYLDKKQLLKEEIEVNEAISPKYIKD